MMNRMYLVNNTVSMNVPAWAKAENMEMSTSLVELWNASENVARDNKVVKAIVSVASNVIAKALHHTTYGEAVKVARA